MVVKPKVKLKCPLELLFRSLLDPLLHFFRMLLTALPLVQSLLLQAVPHSTVHVVTRAKELHDIMLLVALLQKSYQYITLFRVQVRRQVRVHAELRVYSITPATQIDD